LAGQLGIGAERGCLGEETVRGLAVGVRPAHDQAGLEQIPSVGRIAAERHGGLDGDRCGIERLTPYDQAERAVEAGSEAGGEELFRVRTAGVSAEFFGQPQMQVERSVVRDGVPGGSAMAGVAPGDSHLGRVDRLEDRAGVRLVGGQGADVARIVLCRPFGGR